MSDVSTDWHNWFKQHIARRGGLFKFMYDSWVFSNPLYETLFKLFRPPRKILDVGCGYGGCSIILACMGYDVLGVDIDEDMVRQAMTNAALFERIATTPARFELANTFDLSKYYGRFDVAFSDGVIEHFRPEQAVQAIREQAKTATYVIVAVPTRCLNEPFEGYRYPHTLRSLKAVCRRAGLLTIKNLAFGDPPQHILMTLRQITPPLVWGLLFRRHFATKVACVCETRARTKSSEHR